MGVELSLATARARASLQLRARGGGRGKRPKKMKGLARPAKTGPGAACGTGKGGFQSGNVCALEDGIPDKPKSFAKGGALKKSNPKADREKAAKLKAKAAAKQTAKQAADKKKSIAAKKKKAADRKQQKAAKQAADQKAAAEAAAKKKQQMLQKIRVKKANKQIDVVGTPKSVAEQIKEAKTSLASKKLVVVKTPKSIKEEIEDIKAAQAAKEAAAKAKAEANAKAAYEKAKVEAAAAEKAAAEIAAKRAAEKGKPVPIKKVDDPEELAPKPPFTTPNPDQLTTVKTLGGSTGAVLAEANGQRFVVKAGKTPGHIANESQADELYAAAGVAVPRQQLHVDSNGVQKKVAEFVNGKTLAELKVQDKAKFDAAVERVKKDFAADVLFGNRDSVGGQLDNIVVKGGKVYRVDNGGSLTFRAQGKNKPFTDDISEIDTLRDPSVNPGAGSVFGSLSNKEVSQQITKLLKKKEAILAAAKTEELRTVLDQRMKKMVEWQKQQKQAQKAASQQQVSPKIGSGLSDTNKPPDELSLYQDRKRIFGADKEAVWSSWHPQSSSSLVTSKIRSETKISIATRLAERLDKMGIKESDVTDEMLGFLGTGHQLPAGLSTSHERRYRLAAGMADNWAQTSGKGSWKSVGMQYAVADEFQIKKAVYRHMATDKKKHESKVDAIRKDKAVRAVMRAQYDETQAHFERLGIKEVTLERGYKGSGKVDPAGFEQEVSLQPASSFSLSRSTANAFGTNRYLNTTVPVRRILGSCVTGFGCLNEQEFVLLGGRVRGRLRTSQAPGYYGPAIYEPPPQNP
jgi:hypothetical protein